jgi:predicted PurR-regulated permease PerM
MNTQGRYWAFGITSLIAIAILWYFRTIVSYILISWVVSLLGQPVMKFYQKYLKIKKLHIRANNSLCAILTLTTLLLILTGLVSSFVPLVVQQANNLSNIKIDNITTALEEPLKRITAWGQKFGLVHQGMTASDEVIQVASKYIEPSQITDAFRSILAAAGNLAVGLISVLFISFFFLRENKMFTEIVSGFAPKDAREAVSDTTTLLSRYFSGLLLQMIFVVFFLTTIFLVLGVKNALLIAIFAALINIVPYLGPILGCTFAVFITISSNLEFDFYAQTVPLLIKIAITFGVMQFINDWIIQPIIFSNRVLAHPLEIFLVTLAGAKVGGIGGMILAIPAYTVFRVVGRAFFNEFKIIRKMTNSLDEIV